MLTPEYLQGLPAELEKLYLRLEEETIADISRRIAKVGHISDTAEYQILRMRELGAGTEYIKSKIKEYSGLSDDVVEQLFFDAAQVSDEFYKGAYAKAGKEYKPFEYNDFFQQIVVANVNQTKGELSNLTQSMGFSYRGSNGERRFRPVATAYRECLDYAFTQAETGTTDYITAIRNATRRLTESGLQFVDYDSGVVNHVDVAVRRAVLTGISQVTGKISEHNAAELETDIVEVTAHAGARPDHAEWQGGWYSLSGKSKKYRSLAEATGYGRVDGLKGANCRHDFFPVIEGVDVPLYTKEELANIDPPPFEYNGKRYTYYEATQKQRSMERAIRKTKREILAADKTGDKNRFTEKSIRLRRQREEYEKFSKSAGLLTQNERNQVVGFGRSEASRASWAARSAQTSGNGPKGTPPSGSSAPSSAPPSISTVPLSSGNASGKYSGKFASAGIDKLSGSGIMKMGKVKGAKEQLPPDFSKYPISENLADVEKARYLLTSEFGLPDKDIDLTGIYNGEVLLPFVQRLIKIKNETGFKLPNIKAVEVIDGDRCAIAGFKPYENIFYVSRRYFNSKDALIDTLKKWAKDNFFPKQATTVEYLAEHESAHMRIPDSLIETDEAIAIYGNSKLKNTNDKDIVEYFADAVAIHRTKPSTEDKNILEAIEYLKNGGVGV